MTEKKVSLYSISDELIKINEELKTTNGEITPEMERVLSRLSVELSVKVDGVVDYIKQQTSHIEEIKNRRDELSNMHKTKENELDRFKKYVCLCMDMLKEKKLAGKFGSITKRKTGKKLEIFDQDKIPSEYVEVVRTFKIDSAVIKKQIESGIMVDGAKLVDGKESILIK